MSEDYIKNHFTTIKRYASAIENTFDNEWRAMESVLKDNAEFLEAAPKYGVNDTSIDDKYEINIDLEDPDAAR